MDGLEEVLEPRFGQGMERAQGIPEYSIAVISHAMGAPADQKSDEKV